MSRRRLVYVLVLAPVLLVLFIASLRSPTVSAESGAWTQIDDMLSVRAGHTATLLHDGRVLFFGGVRNGGPDTEIYDPADGSWSSAADLTNRYSHTATMLRSGRVLVAGGNIDEYPGVYSETLLYNAHADNWSETGSMHFGRSGHTATMMDDGRVLVTGGSWYDLQSSGVVTATEIYDPASGTWSLTDGLTGLRSRHAAVRLADGRVLVVGGTYNLNSVLDTAEIYDPTTGTWSQASPLGTARAWPAATLLRNGLVLVTGGWNANVRLSSAEIYDPEENTWTSAADMAVGRWNHSATLMPDGHVLVVGGEYNIVSTELYDPSEDTWSATGNLAEPQYYHTATLLAGGQVLIAGGAWKQYFTNNAQLYDPADGNWDSADPMNIARAGHTATNLIDGRLLVAGGGGQASPALASVEIFSPGTGSWEEVAPMTQERRLHTATLLPEGKVLVTGGQDIISETLASTELYNPDLDSWMMAGDLHEARYGHTATVVASGRVLIAGGHGTTGPTATTELLDVATGQFEKTGDMGDERFNHAATLMADFRAIVIGGEDAGGQAIATAEVYNSGNGSWSPVNPMNTARQRHTVTLLPSGLLLVAGGLGNGGSLASAELYNPASNSWELTGSMSNARYDHTATLLADGRVLVTGGCGEEPVPSAEIYDPALGTWFSTTSLGTARAGHRATYLVDGTILVSGGQASGEPGGTDSVERFDPGLGYLPAWQPVLDEQASPLVAGHPATIGGSGFTSDSEGSFGLFYGSATNYPLVQMRRIDNGQVRWLEPDPVKPYTDTLIHIPDLTAFPRGQTMVTVFVNGIPSQAQIILFTHPVDLSINMSVSPGLYLPGTPITYTLTFSNTGHGTAIGVLITDTVPAEITDLQVTSSKQISVSGPTDFGWLVEALSIGESGQITISGLINSPYPNGYLDMSNTANITNAVFDEDLDNNSATITVTNIPVLLPLVIKP